MSNDLIIIYQRFFTSLWSLFTAFRIPGVNFSPAIMLFGILSFFLALKLIHGLLTMTTNGVSDRYVNAHNKAQSIQKRYKPNEK